MKPYSKYFEKIRIRPDPQAEAKSRAPRCQWDGCDEPGMHRAPVGRHAEGQYFRFCVDHARQYNKGYNYFSGLSDTEVARYQKEALTGHRPTWKMGGSGETRAAADFSTYRSGRAAYHNRMGDPFNMFGEQQAARKPREKRLKPLEAKALETLGLGAQATGEQIKSRYKDLVKQHHPDANGGDRGSEDRLRSVLEAYRLLKQAGFC
ncbi:DnaJ domain-containing protein [Nitratireductor aquibiodomus]|uniref:DnaJ domain-containing protein n=1 Tax=Nitratireductor aquibiodomus TaxID=204799 RepID=A0A1H4K4X1_9HYPH|nr:DnaJ domain-containing protein [Nitratireductor aquibiodomus]SEB53148.1 DnaJ domain-containing protein [Nitratireductor aquibiodomus]